MDAGPDLTICESGGQITVPEENVTNYSSFSWSHDGSGVFENENTLAPTYKPGDNEPSSQVTVTLTLNPIDPCIAGVDNDSVSDSVILTLVEGLKSPYLLQLKFAKVILLLFTKHSNPRKP